MPYDAEEFAGGKQVAPRALSSAEWALVDAQIRERAFFMAGVDNARILQAFQDAAREIAAGRMSLPEGRRRLREFLEEIGYEPEPGEEGGLHDLSSRRRLDVALKTNADLAAGWAQRQAGALDIANPGLELYRARQARAPRDWAVRWREAAEAVGWQGVARGGALVALFCSPIWQQLSRFGYPYPPFDFNSGMWVRPVDADACEALGLLEDDGWMERQLAAAGEGLNEGAEADCSGLGDDVLAQLGEALQGVADVADGVARMRDVNGSSPCSAERLAEVVGAELPEGVPNTQRDALGRFAEDGAGALDDAAKAALRRLLGRLQPEADPGPLVREADLPAAGAEAALGALERDGYAAPDGSLAEPWLKRPAAAEAAPVAPAPGALRVRLVWQGARSARNLQPLLRRIGKQPEEALHLIEGCRLRVTGKREERAANGARVIIYTVTEEDGDA